MGNVSDLLLEQFDCCEERTLDSSCAQSSVLQRTTVGRRKRDVLGQGSFCVVLRGVHAESRLPVAVKAYKLPGAPGFSPAPGEKPLDQAVMLRRFRRQVAILLELQLPGRPPGDARLWHARLADLQPEEVFVCIADYSRSPGGEPGPDPLDGGLYIVTELAKESLRAFLARRQGGSQPLAFTRLRQMVLMVVLCVAALHARGLVHLDLKPENLMLCGRDLDQVKLIDVDGCMHTGTLLGPKNETVTFSISYCSPEWARFVAKSSQSIEVLPSLDAWSVGITLCELISFEPILARQFKAYQRRGDAYAQRKAVNYLGSLESAPASVASLDFADPDFRSLVLEFLLQPQQQCRRTLAQCFSHPFLASVPARKAPSPRLWTPQQTPVPTPMATPTRTPVRSPSGSQSLVEMLTPRRDEGLEVSPRLPKKSERRALGKSLSSTGGLHAVDAAKLHRILLERAGRQATTPA